MSMPTRTGIGPGTSLYETITYWAPGSGGPDDYNELGWSSPVTLQGRWIEHTEEVMIPSGEQITSTTQVYLEADVLVRGYLAEGDHTGTATPTNLEAAREVQAFGRFPDLRNMGQQRKAYL